MSISSAPIITAFLDSAILAKVSIEPNGKPTTDAILTDDPLSSFAHNST